MASYLSDARITVFPFTQQPDGEDIIIANANQSAFLSLPASAIDIVVWLDQGKTIGETQELYQQKYGEYPDVDEFLELLESEGFVSSQAAPDTLQSTPQNVSTDLSQQKSTAPMRHHFVNISEHTARLIFSPAVLTFCFLLIGTAIAFLCLQPSIFPAPSILVFHDNALLFFSTLTAFSFVLLFLHEMAHLVAARSLGIPARLSIGQRLWILVAETDVSGIWMAPRKKRYLVLLAGPLLDLVFASIFVMILYCQRQSWLSLPPVLTLFCQAALFTFLPRLLWQCYFFVRTDFYYVFVALFNCKNLMLDTEHFLINQVRRVLPFSHYRDLSRIPAREMWVIRCYSVFWVLGRLVALYTLLFISFPIFLGYCNNVFGAYIHHTLQVHLSFLDWLGWIVLAVVTIGIQIMGWFLWLRSFFRARKG